MSAAGPSQGAKACAEGSAASRLAARAGQVLAQEAQLPSPCISVCRMGEASGLCEGCWRTLDEIRVWSRLDDAGKRVVWARIAERLAAAEPLPAEDAA